MEKISSTQIKTHTASGRSVAWFTLRIKWQSWAVKQKLSPVQTVRGDFRFDQKPENIPSMLQDLINYIEDFQGQIEEATVYDNRRTFPHSQILVYRTGKVRVNNLPDFIQAYATPVLKKLALK
jgi:hypothetical protein